MSGKIIEQDGKRYIEVSDKFIACADVSGDDFHYILELCMRDYCQSTKCKLNNLTLDIGQSGLSKKDKEIK